MKKLIFLAVSLFMLSAVSSARAAVLPQLTNAQVKLSNSIATQTSNYSFSFVAATTATIDGIKFEFCQDASLPSNGCEEPVGLSTLAAAFTQATNSNGLAGTNWILDPANTPAKPKLTSSSPAQLTLGTPVLVTLTGITNPSIEGCQQGGQNSTDTCYVKITTYVGGTATDETIVSFTTVENVVVTARVDPTFTFVVTGVDLNKVNNGITTSVSSSFATLPFGNLTSGVPKYAAHQLNVTTNTVSGYTVDVVVSDQMKGVYGTNNIDAFTAPFGTPTGWSHPTGNVANDNTGWFGANTTDTDAPGWNSTPEGKFGGLVAQTPVNIMKSLSSDNGASPVYVTYVVEANVFQPADTYTGKLNYNALPTY